MKHKMSILIEKFTQKLQFAENVMQIYSPSGYLRCRWVFVHQNRFVEM